MPEFLGKRYVTINLLDGDSAMPGELQPFDIRLLDKGAKLYELPYCSLNFTRLG